MERELHGLHPERAQPCIQNVSCAACVLEGLLVYLLQGDKRDACWAAGTLARRPCSQLPRPHCHCPDSLHTCRAMMARSMDTGSPIWMALAKVVLALMGS